MKVTKVNLKEDFKVSISKTNENGLNQAVWARRSDDLENYFKHKDAIKVLHIKRSSLWQIDPVFDKGTGTLYVQFTDKNLDRILSRFKKEKDITHYIFSFLLNVSEKKPMDGEQMEFLFDEDFIKRRDERRKIDNQKMLGVIEKEVKEVKVISVTYHENLAIYAELIEFTSNLEVSSKKDISSLLAPQYENDKETVESSTNKDNSINDNVEILVKLK